MTEAVEVGLFHACELNILHDEAKTSYIVDRLVEHETEWSDFQKARREIAIARLAEHYRPDSQTRIHEVWRLPNGDIADPALVGLVGFTDILLHVDAQFHPVFFDGKLSNLYGKTTLLLKMMEYAFRAWGLHRLSMELPGDKLTLVAYARKKLGFRFEAEHRSIEVHRAAGRGYHHERKRLTVYPAPPEAELGSRRYQALRKNDKWLDMILLSITEPEFADFVTRGKPWDSSSIDPTLNKLSPKT